MNQHALDFRNRPEQVIDRACDLLIQHDKRYLNVKTLLADLNALLPENTPKIAGSVFSNSRTVLFKYKDTYERQGKTLTSLDNRQLIASLLIQLVAQKTQIQFDEDTGLFINGKDGAEKWGVFILPEKRGKTPFATVDISAICNEIGAAQKRVDIQHTFISDVLQVYKACKDALERNLNCTIRVMIMEPNSISLLLRERSLSKKGRQPELVKSKSKENFRLFSELALQYKDRFLFATYDESPGTTLFRIDNKLYVGFQWNHKYIYEGSHYVADFDEKNPFHLDIQSQFEKMWEDNFGQIKYPHSYVMYFLRGKEQKEYVIEFNNENFKARMTKTQHRLDFKGYVVEQESNNDQCAFQLTTTYSTESEHIDEQRCAQIHTNISKRTWSEPNRIYVGQYTILTNAALLKSNTVLLVKSEENANLNVQQKQLIHDFLANPHSTRHNSEIEIPAEITSWDKLKDWVEQHQAKPNL